MDNGASIYRRFLEGDEDALDELIVQFSDGLIQYLKSITGNICIAEEIMEEVFVTLVADRPEFSGKSSFKTWLYAIARHTAADCMKEYDRISQEITASVRRKAQARIEEKKRRRKLIFRSTIATAVCAAAMVGVIAVSGDVFRGAPDRKSRDYRQETVSTETTAAEQFTEETDPSALPEEPVRTTEIQQGTAETTTNNMPEHRTEAAQSGTHTTAAGSGSNTTPGQRRTVPHTTAASQRETTTVPRRTTARQTTVPPVRTTLRQTTTARRTDLPQEQTTAAVTDWRPQTRQPTIGAYLTMITPRYDPDCKYSFV